MPDPDNMPSLAERMALIAAEAKGGVVASVSTGEIIEEPGRVERGEFGASSVSTPEHQAEQRERNAALSAAVDEMPVAPAMQPGVGTTFTPTPDAPQPVIEPVAEVLPTPEPIIVTTAPPPPEPEQPRAEEPKAEPEIEQPNRTADAPYAASSMGQIIDMMERGAFSQESVQAFQALARGMAEIADVTQKKQKGKITLTISLTTEGEAFFMEGDFKVTAPKLPRPRTIGWQTNDGRISPTQPRQQIMFGRDVGDYGERGGVRSITEARVVRNVP